MPAPTLIDRHRHRDTRVDPAAALARAATVLHAPIGLSEFAPAAANYPLVFVKCEETGRLGPACLFGVRDGCNVFAVPGGWNATYLPVAVLAWPFALAREHADETPSLCVDEEGLAESGQALFTPAGAESPYLLRMKETLARALTDRPATEAFTQALLEHGLIRPITLDVYGEDGAEAAVEGLYGISPPRLRALPDAAVLALHRADHLLAAQAVVLSLGQLNRVQQMHNQRFQPRIRRLDAQMEL